MNIRSSPLGLIRVHNINTGAVISVNSTDQNYVYITGNTLYFFFPNNTFTFGQYYITLDAGNLIEFSYRFVLIKIALFLKFLK